MDVLLAFGGLTGLLLRSVAHVAELPGRRALAVGLGTALAARAKVAPGDGRSDSGTTGTIA